jgi:hypothetical protein
MRAATRGERIVVKKRKKLTKAKLVKSAARAQLGMPPPSRRAPDPTKEKKQKHKSTLGKLLTED